VKSGILNVSEDPPCDSLGNSAKTVQLQWPLASRTLACSLGTIAPLKSWLANWDLVRPKETVTQIVDEFPQHIQIHFYIFDREKNRIHSTYRTKSFLKVKRVYIYIYIYIYRMYFKKRPLISI